MQVANTILSRRWWFVGTRVWRNKRISVGNVDIMLAKFSALRKFKGRGIHSWVVDTIALGPVA